jgi:AFG3 family protein
MSPDAVQTNERDFRTDMLAKGDVDKLELIKNKELVRVFIKPESLNKPYYVSRLKRPATGSKGTSL